MTMVHRKVTEASVSEIPDASVTVDASESESVS